MWMAGGGIKPGMSYGQTDEFCYNAAPGSPKVPINATILHCLGIDHERLTYKHQGLDFKLTGVEAANPIVKILA